MTAKIATVTTAASSKPATKTQETQAQKKYKRNNLIRERQFKMITSIDITVIIVTVPDICT